MKSEKIEETKEKNGEKNFSFFHGIIILLEIQDDEIIDCLFPNTAT